MPSAFCDTMLIFLNFSLFLASKLLARDTTSVGQFGTVLWQAVYHELRCSVVQTDRFSYIYKTKDYSLFLGLPTLQQVPSFRGVSSP